MQIVVKQLKQIFIYRDLNMHTCMNEHEKCSEGKDYLNFLHKFNSMFRFTTSETQLK